MSNFSHAAYSNMKDEHLVRAMLQGDTTAFNELYSRYSRRLMYYFYRMLGNDEEKSRDFLQDIFVKIIERPELFDESRRFSTWIFSVAHNMCKNEYRRMTVRNSAEYEDLCTSESGMVEVEMADIQLTAEQIFATIDMLGETEKTAFILYYREDFSIREISRILSLPEGTVKSKLFYARKKLSDLLQTKEKVKI